MALQLIMILLTFLFVEHSQCRVVSASFAAFFVVETLLYNSNIMKFHGY